jgi:predicted outer membrane repeat protein
LAASLAGDEILLSAGTYLEHDLELVDGVSLRGQTGDATDVVIDAEELGRVLRAIQVGAGTRIEGITLRGGLVRGSCAADPGTGAYCMGGGAFLLESAPAFTNCVFLDHVAEDNGGAVASILSAPTFSGCRFVGNRARHGGAMTFAASSLAGAAPELQFCVFESNTADADGGAIYVYLSDPLITRSTFRANESGEQGSSVFWYEPTPPIIERCIFAFGQGGEAMFSGIAGAAPVLVCCNVAGNAGGDWVGCLAGQELASGNLSLDPLFCAAQGAELRGNSPCAASSCGFIGATSEFCAATGVGEAIETRSWGLVKSAYRSP